MIIISYEEESAFSISPSFPNIESETVIWRYIRELFPDIEIIKETRTDIVGQPVPGMNVKQTDWDGFKLGIPPTV